MLKQSPRGCDDDIREGLQGFYLVLGILTSDDDGGADLGVLRQQAALLVDLPA